MEWHRMKSRVFYPLSPIRRHLLAGRGLNGEVLDLRKDVNEALSRLETETILDIAWLFDGATLPSPGLNTGRYGLCVVDGIEAEVGTVWYDDGRKMNNVTRKGIVISPRSTSVGDLLVEAGGIYMLSSETKPYVWLPKGGSGGGTAGDAVAIQGFPVNATPPASNQVLVFDGAQYIPANLTMDMIGPAFAISSFSVSGATIEVGQQSNTPSFSASYSLAPDATPGSIVLTDNEGNPAKDVTGTPSSFTSDYNFVKNAPGTSVSFTLTAKRGSMTKTASTSLSWQPRLYWGVGLPGTYTDAFIRALSGSTLKNARAHTFTANAGAGQKIFFCYRAALGEAEFSVGGFSGGFFKAAASVPVTNVHGWTDNYAVWESNNFNLGSTTVAVT